MKRAFAYCRVSTEEQSRDDHYSLAPQEERCRDFAKARPRRITKVRKDVGSARNGDRPGFQELLQDVSAGAIDVVIVYRLDRLSRNVRDVYDFLEPTRQANVGFVSTSESFDTTTAMGRAMLGVAAVFPQLTREMIGENTRDGVAKRARSGKYTGSAGNPPYEYTYSAAEGKLLVRPTEAEKDLRPQSRSLNRQAGEPFVYWDNHLVCLDPNAPDRKGNTAQAALGVDDPWGEDGGPLLPRCLSQALAPPKPAPTLLWGWLWRA